MGEISHPGRTSRSPPRYTPFRTPASGSRSPSSGKGFTFHRRRPQARLIRVISRTDPSDATRRLSDLRRAQPADATLKNLLGVLNAKLELCASLPVFEWEAGTEGYESARPPSASSRKRSGGPAPTSSTSCGRTSSSAQRARRRRVTRVIIVADSGPALASLTAAVAPCPAPTSCATAAAPRPLDRLVAPLAPDLVRDRRPARSRPRARAARRGPPRCAGGEGRRPAARAPRPPGSPTRCAHTPPPCCRAASSRTRSGSCCARCSRRATAVARLPAAAADAHEPHAEAAA